ncbi:MAG: histidinol-phosphatase [Lysobacteraceae bacterium]|nr:MAG: histidinol-phosphatase [Xanthomonadaceae bacterium]
MLSDLLQCARDAAELADQVIRQGYGGDFDVNLKADSSPVTEVDIAAERVIRQRISEQFPDHAIFGEELGRDQHQPDQPLWLIDPIDGTKSFVRRYPFFSTQIAVWLNGRVVVGVSNAPLAGQCLWATEGGGAWLNGDAVQVSRNDKISNSTVSTGNLRTLTQDVDAWSRLGKLLGACDRTRGYGDYYHYHLLARGAIDVVVESDVNILDIAALSLAVQEAGGQFTDLRGAPITLDVTHVLASNGRLHQSVLESLAF